MSDVLIDLIEDWIAEQEALNNPPAEKGKGVDQDNDDE